MRLDAVQLLSFKEVHQLKLKGYKPVEPWEYNLTEAEEAEALAEAAAGEAAGDEDDAKSGDSSTSDEEICETPVDNSVEVGPGLPWDCTGATVGV